jgi:acylaminoacyl-peptidase
VAILDVSPISGHIAFTVSAPNAPPRLGLCNFAAGATPALAPPAGPRTVSAQVGLGGAQDWDATRASVEGIRWRVLPLQGAGEGAGIPFEAVLVVPGGVPPEGGFPMVVVPHGGPHSCLPTGFNPSWAFLAAHLRVAVLGVNYRGSTGYGEASILSLPGRCGTQDVADCLTAIQAAAALGEPVRQCPLINGALLAVVGGSHGGYLAGHLTGQHPDLFRASVVRNPVTNIPAMVGVTDIPDWCFVEALGEGSYDFATHRTPTAEELGRMHDASPIAHIDAMRTPTLVCLGLKDRRVPPSQGIEYYHLLRARGVPTKLLTFPEDSHAIDRPASEAHHWVEIADWLQANGVVGY